MSYDNRLIPEDHEPFAIKIREEKHTAKKIIILSVAAALVIALGAFSYIRFSSSIKDFFSNINITEAFANINFLKKTEKETEPEKLISHKPDKTLLSSYLGNKEKKENEKAETVIETATETEIIPKETVETETEIPVLTETEIPTTKPVIPKDEWYMVLANKENTLSKNFKVKTKVIDANGREVDERIAENLTNFLSAAEKAGFDLYVVTGYRTYAKQKELYDNAVLSLVSSGLSEENAKSAAASIACLPGASDHNTGLGVDIVNKNGELKENSKAYKWLTSHAHEYGFILRYPKGKESITGQNFETYHYRYVGTEQAKLIYESGLCLEEYLAQ